MTEIKLNVYNKVCPMPAALTRKAIKKMQAQHDYSSFERDRREDYRKMIRDNEKRLGDTDD